MACGSAWDDGSWALEDQDESEASSLDRDPSQRPRPIVISVVSSYLGKAIVA